MRMRNLNVKTVSDIHEGQAIKIKHEDGKVWNGVTYEVDMENSSGIAIRCKGENHSAFGIGRYAIEVGKLKFAILKKHPLAIANN